jgi:hypothetical protein
MSPRPAPMRGLRAQVLAHDVHAWGAHFLGLLRGAE